MVFVSLGLDCKKITPIIILSCVHRLCNWKYVVDPLAYSTFFYPSENGPGERKEKMRPKNVIVF